MPLRPVPNLPDVITLNLTQGYHIDILPDTRTVWLVQADEGGHELEGHDITESTLGRLLLQTYLPDAKPSDSPEVP